MLWVGTKFPDIEDAITANYKALNGLVPKMTAILSRYGVEPADNVSLNSAKKHMTKSMAIVCEALLLRGLSQKEPSERKEQIVQQLKRMANKVASEDLHPDILAAATIRLGT